MKPIAPEIVERAVQILGTEGISEDDIEAQIAVLVSDPMEARRLIDWIPEAFGIVLVAHLGDLVLPKQFSALNAKGKEQLFPFTSEPIFLLALQMAQVAYHNGPSKSFQNVAFRSSTVRSVDNLLSAGGSLDGAVCSGPALIGIPAEVYSAHTKPFWRRLFSW